MANQEKGSRAQRKLEHVEREEKEKEMKVATAI